jgi:hypothetical protein
MRASMSCVRAVARALFRKDLANNREIHHAIIIAGFCAIGKTHFCSNRVGLEPGMGVHDLDSSAYSSKPDFPQNYISAIRKLAEKPCIILVSTHRGLPSQLAKEGYYVAVVYPGDGSQTKREWLRRLEEREEGGKDSRLYKLTVPRCAPSVVHSLRRHKIMLLLYNSHNLFQRFFTIKYQIVRC